MDNTASSFDQDEQSRRERKLNYLRTAERFSLEKFIKKNRIKDKDPDHLPLVLVEKQDTGVWFDECFVSFDKSRLKEIKLFGHESHVIVDNVEQTTNIPAIYKSKDCDAAVTFTSEGALHAVTSSRSSDEIIKVGQQTYVLLKKEIAEKREFSGRVLHAVHPPSNATTGSNLRRRQQTVALEDMMIPGRALTESTCDSYWEVEVIFVVDSRTCLDLGGTDELVKLVFVQVLEKVNEIYDALCIKILPKDLIIFCDQNTDPIHQMIQDNQNNLCSKGQGLLREFRNELVSSSGIAGLRFNESDIWHLYYGYDYGDTIGCAYVNTLCHGNGYNLAGSELMFSDIIADLAALTARK